MMQQWNCDGSQIQPWGGDQMMQPIVCPTQYRCHDEFMPREVPYIHPIVNVNRQHVVEIPRHFYTETTQNVMGDTLPAMPGFGPQFGGGYGPEVGGIGMGPGFDQGFGPGQGGCGGRRRGW